MRYSIIKATKRRDKRGFLVDFLKGDEVEGSDRQLGQIYLVTFDKKNVIRGNHYHKNKKEWFVAIKGKLKVMLEDLENTGACWKASVELAKIIISFNVSLIV